MTKQELLNKYYPLAVKATTGTGIFPQTLITQLIAESGYKLSKLATDYNNFFGIKAGSMWSGKVVSMNVFEYTPAGQRYTVSGTGKLYANKDAAIKDGAKAITLFRVYSDVTNGFRGWVNFLQSNQRYKKVFKANTPEQQFKELKAAGYATSPTYEQYLNSIYSGIRSLLPDIKTIAKGGSTFLLAALITYGLYTIAKK